MTHFHSWNRTLYVLPVNSESTQEILEQRRDFLNLVADVFASNYYLQCKVALGEVSHLALPWLPARGTAQDQGSRLAALLLWLLEIFRYRTQFLSSTEAGKSFNSETIFNPRWVGLYPANSLYTNEGQIQHTFKLLASH